MTDNMKNLMERLSTDEKLKSDLEEICKLEVDEVKQAILKLAGDHGLTLTKEDLDETEREAAEMERRRDRGRDGRQGVRLRNRRRRKTRAGQFIL